MWELLFFDSRLGPNDGIIKRFSLLELSAHVDSLSLMQYLYTLEIGELGYTIRDSENQTCVAMIVSWRPTAASHHGRRCCMSAPKK